MSQYRIVYLDPNGVYVTTITKFYRIEYGRKENDFGSLQLDLPSIYPSDYFRIDGRLEIWRSPDYGNGEFLDGETQWFIRIVRDKIDEQRRKVIHILAYDAVEIVDRRIIAYPSGHANSSFTGHGDDIIKDIMRKNFGSLCVDTTRDISDWLAIQIDLPQATVSMTRKSAWQKILPELQGICDESRDQNNEYLCFDVVRTAYNLLEFRTYFGARGTDRGINSKYPVVFSYDNLGLSYSSISFDASTEWNFIYVGGKGTEDDRKILYSFNTTRMDISPFNRREDFYNASNDDTDAEVQSSGDRWLAQHSSKVVFNGHIDQKPGAILGVHYNFGDIVVAKINNYSFDVHLYSYSITASEGKETITVNARNLDEENY